MSLELADCISVVVTESNTNVSVGIAGIQGPIGIPGSGSSSTNLSGYITTGNADLRYYPVNSNPSGYLTGFNSGQYITTGETGEFYPYSNPLSFSSSGNVQNTGQITYNLIIGLSGQLNQTGGLLSAVKVTGSSIIPIVNLTGAGDVIVSNSGQFVFISGNTGYLGGYATVTNLASTGQQSWNTSQNNAINLSGNLQITGSNLDNKINSLSGYSNNNFYTKNNESGFLNTLSGLSTGYVQNISGEINNRLTSTGSNLLDQINSINQGTGNFYLNSNPSQFIRSGDVSSSYATILNLQSTGQTNYNLIIGLSGQLNQTGSNLQSQINTIVLNTGNFISNSQTGQFYPYSNPLAFSSSGNVANTGTAVYNLIIGLSGQTGYLIGYATINNLALTGEQNWNTANNNAINLSGNLQASGSNLYNLINTERNKPTITGLSVTGGSSLTGLINFTTAGDTQVTQNGNSIQFSCPTVNNIITGNGTINYIPKFISNTGLSNSSIIDSGNKIYINTNLAIDGNGVLYFTGSSGDAGNLIVRTTGNNSMEYISFASPKRIILRDDFVGGSNGDGTRGELSWRSTTIGGGTPTYTQGFTSNPLDAHHPGILNVNTPATSGQGAIIWLSYTNASSFSSLYTTDWEAYFTFKLSHSGSLIGTKMGFLNGAGWDGSQGLYLRYEPSGAINDTGYMCVNRLGGANNVATPLGIAPDGAWHTLKMWKYNNTGIVNFSLDGGNTTQIAHNSANGAFLAFFSVVSYTGAAVTLSADYFGFEGFLNR